MKDCEHLLEEIADRQKDILSILQFFKVVVIVLLSFLAVSVLVSGAWWVFVFVSLSQIIR